MANKSTKPNDKETGRVVPGVSNQPAKEALSPEIIKAIQIIKQAADEEKLIFKAKINTSARTAYQALKIYQAKKVAGAGGEDKKALETFYAITMQHGFAKRTVQRRVQIAVGLINYNVVSTEFQAQVEMVEGLDADLLAKLEAIIEAKVGSPSATALMQWLGIVERVESDDKEPSAEEQTLEERVRSKLDATYKFIDKVYEFRREMRAEGIAIPSDLLEVFNSLDNALVALGSYLSPNRLAYEQARIQQAKDAAQVEGDAPVNEEPLEAHV